VVFFQHGFLDSSAGLCLGQPGLPYMLSEKGYDVWLGNNRGDGQTTVNIHYNSTQSAYWQFTWDDMANYDLPAHINYVLNVTGVQSLSYMGHSEGTTQAFSGFVLHPDVAAKVNVFIAMAPVVFIGHCTSTLLDVMARLDLDNLIANLGDGEFYLPNALHKLLPETCKLDPKLCDNSLALVMGKSNNLNNTRLPYIMHYEPNPTSVKNLIKWSQSIRSGKFQMFDYGTKGNQAHYNQPTPPQYDLSKLSLNIALFTGGDDDLADPRDVAFLLTQLTKKPFVHNEPTYAHLDPIWAYNAYQRIYPTIIDIVDNPSAYFPA